MTPRRRTPIFLPAFGVLLSVGVMVLPLARPALAAALAPWKMAVVAVKADSAFQEIAVRKGFYREQGLDAEIVYQAGDIPVFRALLGGLVDVAELSPANPMTAIEKGATVKVVASFMPGLPFMLFGKDDIKAPKERSTTWIPTRCSTSRWAAMRTGCGPC